MLVLINDRSEDNISIYYHAYQEVAFVKTKTSPTVTSVIEVHEGDGKTRVRSVRQNTYLSLRVDTLKKFGRMDNV